MGCPWRTVLVATGFNLLFEYSMRGINTLLSVVVVWWGGLQSVMTFYVANRIAPRD